MSDRDCPIGDCGGTVAFDEPVVEVTPRFQLHDLGEVDEFVACSDCEAEVGGFHEEPADGGVELILDIDEDDDDVTDASNAKPSDATDANASHADANEGHADANASDADVSGADGDDGPGEEFFEIDTEEADEADDGTNEEAADLANDFDDVSDVLENAGSLLEDDED